MKDYWKKWQVNYSDWEEYVAKLFDGSTTPGSGAGSHKGDANARIGDLPVGIECKETSKNSFSLSKKVWGKIHKETVYDRGVEAMLAVSLDKVGLAIVDISLLADISQHIKRLSRKNHKLNRSKRILEEHINNLEEAIDNDTIDPEGGTT